jgi:altronate dehydratase small subunit
MKTVTAINDIQIYHKIAIKGIKKGEPVIKYGQHIGVAKKDIKVGEHVHVHNVISHRENL